MKNEMGASPEASEHKSQNARALAKEARKAMISAHAANGTYIPAVIELLDALEREPVSAEEVEALKREIIDLKAFIRGIGINCQRAGADLAQVAASAKAATKDQQS